MNRPTVYLVIGVPGAGKTWLCRQLGELYNYVPHDQCWTHPSARPGPDYPDWGPPGSKSTHAEEITQAARSSMKPVVTEVPFGESRLRDELVNRGIKVVPVFVIEDVDTHKKRYAAREGIPLPKSAASRAASIRARAKEWRAFAGSSEEVLDHLRELRAPKSMSEAAQMSLER